MGWSGLCTWKEDGRRYSLTGLTWELNKLGGKSEDEIWAGSGGG